MRGLVNKTEEDNECDVEKIDLFIREEMKYSRYRLILRERNDPLKPCWRMVKVEGSEFCVVMVCCIRNIRCWIS